MSAQPDSVAEVSAGLRGVGYLPGQSTALVAYLATKLGKPVLVEGPAGVGKTELAKALSRYLGRRLVRLQCYEGLDEAKALYEWNYRKQLLRIQTEAAGTAWQDVQEDIFSEDFLMARDGEQMTRALIDIARDADLRASLVRSGLETIKARHTCTHRVDELLAIAVKLRTEVREPVLESAA